MKGSSRSSTRQGSMASSSHAKRKPVRSMQTASIHTTQRNTTLKKGNNKIVTTLQQQKKRNIVTIMSPQPDIIPVPRATVLATSLKYTSDDIIAAKKSLPTHDDLNNAITSIYNTIIDGSFGQYNHIQHKKILEPLSYEYWSQRMMLSSSTSSHLRSIDTTTMKDLFSHKYDEVISKQPKDVITTVSNALEVYNAHKILSSNDNTTTSSLLSSQIPHDTPLLPRHLITSSPHDQPQPSKQQIRTARTLISQTVSQMITTIRGNQHVKNKYSLLFSSSNNKNDNDKKDDSDKKSSSSSSDNNDNDNGNNIKNKQKNALMIALLVAFPVLTWGLPLASLIRDYSGRLVNTYEEFYTKYLSHNMVDNITVMGTRIRAKLNDGNIYVFDTIDPTLFAQRLTNDLTILGTPDLSIIHKPPVDYSLLLSSFHQFMSFMIMIPILAYMLRIPQKLSSSMSMTMKSGQDNPTFKPQKNIETRFKDVAGMDEAKAEIMEFVDILKNPERYNKLGAKLPKGALLSGPPGTGKTLLAKATAGEAGVPFFAVSGSEFQQMYVGVGPKMVRDLFKKARKQAPSIIFIDEIDSVARARSSSNSGRGSDERESTLNEMLVAMDGFSSDTPVVVLAATNRPELLDDALTRPGRIDRKIPVNGPDLHGREQIFNVYLPKLKMDDATRDGLAPKLAALTPGMVGADIANVCNEAAIGAARNNRSGVELIDFSEAIDRVSAGLAKKNHLANAEERKIVAYHEAGHAVAGWFLDYSPLLKVSIVPRTNGALGFAQYLPKEDSIDQTDYLMDYMAVALAGRASEQLAFGKITTGASDDIKRTTSLATKLITHYGMLDTLAPNVAFGALDGDKGGYGNTYRNMSDHTLHKVDIAATEIIEKQYKRVLDLLVEKKAQIEVLAERLLIQDSVNHDELLEILGPRPTKSDEYTEYLAQSRELQSILQAKASSTDTTTDTPTTTTTTTDTPSSTSTETKTDDKKDDKKE